MLVTENCSQNIFLSPWKQSLAKQNIGDEYEPANPNNLKSESSPWVHEGIHAGMRNKDGGEVDVNELRVAHSGEAQLGSITQGHQAKGEPNHKPAVIYTADARVQPEK